MPDIVKIIFFIIIFLLPIVIPLILIAIEVLKKEYNPMNLIKISITLLFFIAIVSIIEDENIRKYIANSFFEEKTPVYFSNIINKIAENLLEISLVFSKELMKVVTISSLASFIISYRREKSESKNEQVNNLTENNQTDTSKPEPEQSSEEKESPHD